MIENAYYQCRPPTQQAAAPKKVRPPVHEYIRKSLFVDLTPYSTEQILKRLRKLSWDADTELYVLKCLVNVPMAKYGSIGSMASVASGLNKYHSVGIPLVDAVL